MIKKQNKMNIRSLVLTGTSALLLAGAGALHAEEESGSLSRKELSEMISDAMKRGFDGDVEVSGVDVAKDDSNLPSIGNAIDEAIRALPDDMDPLAKKEVRRLDEFGVLTRQKEVGEDILIIERELSRAESIDKLIEYMGIDGFKASFPELHDLMKDSPVMLRAEIHAAELKNELDEALNPPKKDGSLSEVPLGGEIRNIRDDGSSYFQMPSMGEQEPEEPPREELSISELVEELKDRTSGDEEILELFEIEIEEEEVEEEEPEDQPVSISLREVYGIGGDFYAIIIHGDERIRVSRGDELPGDTKILSIRQDHITIKRGDREMKIRIQG